MISDKIIIEIQKAGTSVQVVPMAEGSPMFKIVSGGRIIAENLTRTSAESLIQQAKDKMILG